MIVKNFFNLPSDYKTLHDGEGKAKNVRIFVNEDFDTKLRFINYTELDPSASIGYHSHDRNEEVYVILEGEGIMTVNDVERPANAGDVFVNKMGWSHGLVNTSNNPLRLLVFEVVE